MKKDQEDDFIRIKDLLQHSREFIAYFEIAETKMMEWRLEIEQQAMRLQEQQEKIRILTEKSLEKIDQQSMHGIQHINNQLAQYDPLHFQRITNECSAKVQQVAQDTLQKSNKLLQMFPLRVNLAAVMITLLTAFIIVLYIGGELPWEMHHTAKNERQAGKMLLEIWPKLSQEEKTKILGYNQNS